MLVEADRLLPLTLISIVCVPEVRRGLAKTICFLAIDAEYVSMVVARLPSIQISQMARARRTLTLVPLSSYPSLSKARADENVQVIRGQTSVKWGHSARG